MELMKKLICSFLFLYSFIASAGVSIISDLDDTIKITNAGHLPTASYNGVFTEKVFLGMPEFLAEARNYSNALHIVTASPKIIAPRVRATLRKNGIAFDSVSLRNVLKEKDKLAFKVKAISRVIDTSADEIILIGDDVDKDPEVFEEVQKLYPHKVMGSYIHVVSGRTLSSKVSKYWTTFDLALREFLAGRMDLTGVERVTKVMLDSERLKYIFPKFADCPSQGTVFEWQLQTVFMKEAQELTQKLTNYCLTRSSKAN